jgi:hypothetical protein
VESVAFLKSRSAYYSVSIPQFLNISL